MHVNRVAATVAAIIAAHFPSLRVASDGDVASPHVDSYLQLKSEPPLSHHNTRACQLRGARGDVSANWELVEIRKGTKGVIVGGVREREREEKGQVGARRKFDLIWSLAGRGVAHDASDWMLVATWRGPFFIFDVTDPRLSTAR